MSALEGSAPRASCLIDGATSEAAITATEWIGSRSPRISKLYMAYEQINEGFPGAVGKMGAVV